MTPEEKRLQEEKEAADKAAIEAARSVDSKAKAVAAEEAAYRAALAKLDAEQVRIEKERADLHAKLAADKVKRVKVEDLPPLLITAPENEWKDREKLLKDREEKKK